MLVSHLTGLYWWLQLQEQHYSGNRIVSLPHVPTYWNDRFLVSWWQGCVGQLRDQRSLGCCPRVGTEETHRRTRRETWLRFLCHHGRRRSASPLRSRSGVCCTRAGRGACWRTAFCSGLCVCLCVCFIFSAIVGVKIASHGTFFPLQPFRKAIPEHDEWAPAAAVWPTD